MIFILIFLILFMLFIYGMCDAADDIIWNKTKYDASIFKKLKNQAFWDMDRYWNKVPVIYGYPVNAWHILKSLKLICVFILPFLYLMLKTTIFSLMFPSINIYLGMFLDFLFIGFFEVSVFNIFYNKIFFKKK